MSLLAPGIGPFGIWELLLILLIVVLVFGVGRLPEVGGAVGKSIKEFRKTVSDPDDENKPTDPSTAPSGEAAADAAPAAAADVFCTECGGKNAVGAKFCASCGKALTAAAV
jgi:sec-independent protein translocase protein TatA